MISSSIFFVVIRAGQTRNIDSSAALIFGFIISRIKFGLLAVFQYKNNFETQLEECIFRVFVAQKLTHSFLISIV